MDRNSSKPPPSMEETFEHLYPSLLQCFTIILLGYCVGRLGYISPTSSKGIGVFVSLVSLPALVFKSMVELDFSQVNWRFLFGILIAKSTVFFSVVLFTLVLVRPTNFGKAGIYGIFCSQSNDLSLGYPLVQAIYQDLHPEYVSYLYLMLPISLVILNPIGFILMEIQKQRSTTRTVSKLRITLTALKGVVTDPIVFMTFIGLTGHFIFHGQLPAVLNQILGALGQAFLATALFFLGVKMVGSMKTKVGSGLVVPFLLISAKLVLLPLIAREMIQVLNVGSSTNETNSWSMFGFLYGTFPAAPSSAIFAAKYGIEEQLVTSTMVISTFLSAPVMFISAQMSLLNYNTQTAINFEQILKNAMVDISGTSLPFGVCVIAVLFLGRRHRIYPHNYTICLVLCQLLACLASILSKIPSQSQHWMLFVTVSFYFGLWGSRCWTAMVAFSLYLVRCKGDETVKKLRVLIWMFGLGLPALSSGVVTAILAHSPSLKDNLTPLFIYTMVTEKPAMIASASILLLCAVIIVVSLVYLQRCDLYCKCSQGLQTPCVQAQDDCNTQAKETERCNRCLEKDKLIGKTVNSAGCQPFEKCESCKDGDAEDSNVVNIEDLDESTCLLNKVKCKQRTFTDEETLSTEVEAIFGGKSVEMDLGVFEYLQGEKHQLERHVTMLLILLLTIIVFCPLCFSSPGMEQRVDVISVIVLLLNASFPLKGLFLALWHLLEEDTSSGIFIALRIVDTFCMFGQIFVVFACFGFEKQLIIIPFLARWRKFWYGVEEITLPKFEDIDPDVVQLCDQFKRYHKQRCQQFIVSDQRYRLRKYKSVFRGDQLVDWLIEVGVAADRQAATHYGNCLILGRLISHVTQAHFFYDSPYLYKFCSKSKSCQDDL